MRRRNTTPSRWPRDEAMQELLKAMQEYAAQLAAQRTSYSDSTGGGSTSSGTASSGAGPSGTGGAYGNTSNASGAYNGTFIWPVDSTYITSRYGERSAPTAGASTNHKAIDIGAKSGDPIYAAADGQVASATYNNGLGYYVSIEHDGETATRYSHMTNFIVQPGEHVKQGQIIGYVGENGIATGDHWTMPSSKTAAGRSHAIITTSTVTYDPTARPRRRKKKHPRYQPMKRVPKIVWSLLACVICIVVTAAACLILADSGSVLR